MKPEIALGNATEQTDSDRLLAAQQEIHELALQFALGKAEASDKFEEIKKDFTVQIRQIKNSLKPLVDITVSPEIWVKLDDLEFQLSTGEAKSKRLFEEHKVKILNALSAFEGEAINYFKSHNLWKTFGHEAEKFKLKLEILRLRFVLKKFEINEGYESMMKNARSEFEKLTQCKDKSITVPRQDVLDEFKDEISVAYDHIRKALATLK